MGQTGIPQSSLGDIQWFNSIRLCFLLRLLQVLLSPFSPNHIQRSLFHRKGEHVFISEFRYSDRTKSVKPQLHPGGPPLSSSSFLSSSSSFDRYFLFLVISIYALIIFFTLCSVLQVMTKEAVSPSCASSTCPRLRCPISCYEGP